MKKFSITTIIYQATDSGTIVFRDAKTIGYQFINTGNCAVWLNNFLLQPNAVLKTVESQMIDATSYRMNFIQFDSCATANAELTVLLYQSEQ